MIINILFYKIYFMTNNKT